MAKRGAIMVFEGSEESFKNFIRKKPKTHSTKYYVYRGSSPEILLWDVNPFDQKLVDALGLSMVSPPISPWWTHSSAAINGA